MSSYVSKLYQLLHFVSEGPGGLAVLRAHHLQLLHLLPELGGQLPVLGQQTRHLKLVTVLDLVHLLLVLRVLDGHLLVKLLHRRLGLVLVLSLLGDPLVGEVIICCFSITFFEVFFLDSIKNNYFSSREVDSHIFSSYRVQMQTEISRCLANLRI